MAGSGVKHSLRQVMLCSDDSVRSGNLDSDSCRFDSDH